MIRPIVEFPAPILRAVCDPVDGDVSALSRDLFDTMYEAKGRGCAAPQVGVSLRLFVTDCTWKDGLPDPRVFVNPKIIATDGVQVNEEGCLSIPNKTRKVKRPAVVTLVFDGKDSRRIETFTGFAAAVICHEMDHLDGRLILDHPVAK